MCGEPDEIKNNTHPKYITALSLRRYIVIAGILISSFSAGLGSLFGGSRVLQAIARDDLYPVLKPFKFGSKHGDEPRVAVMGTWFVAQCCVLIGNLDVVAPIITSIFSLTYAHAHRNHAGVHTVSILPPRLPYKSCAHGSSPCNRVCVRVCVID